MPPPDPDQFADQLADFDKAHKEFIGGVDGRRSLKLLATFSKNARALDGGAPFGKNDIAGAQATLDWLLRMPEAMLGNDKAPLHNLRELPAKDRARAVAQALQVIAIGARALLLGAAWQGDHLERAPLAVLQVAFGADSAALALRKPLLIADLGFPGERKKWPTPEQLIKLIVAGTWRELVQTFARCGLAAQRERDWVSQVRPLGRVVALPSRACGSDDVQIDYADFGSAPPANGDVLLSIPTRQGCRHVSLRDIAPQLFAPGGWQPSGSVTFRLPADVFSGAIGFFSTPAPQLADGGCGAGSLLTAAGMLQSVLRDTFGAAAVAATQSLLQVAGHIEAARFRALPCAVRQADGKNWIEAGAPFIERFAMLERRNVHPEGSFTLAWEVANCDSVTITPRAVAQSESPHELPPSSVTFGASGRIVVRITCTRRWEAEYVLRAYNANNCGAPVEQAVRIRSGFSDFLLGAGKADVTDRRPDLPMAGFAYSQQISRGTVQRDAHQREVPLYARAFYIGEHRLSSARRELLIVVADIWTCTIAVKSAVVTALNRRFPSAAGLPPRWDEANVMVAGTHTHAAPGGYSDYALYNLTMGGFDQTVFDTIVEGVALAGAQAIRSAKAGRLLVNSGEVEDCGANRSLAAFQRNPEFAAGVEPTDREMLLLKFMRDTDNLGGSEPLGALNWYAIHPTSLGMYNRVISGDNKGWAAMLFEETMLSAPGQFVAAFGNASAGDVSGNYVRDANGVAQFVRPLGGELPEGDSFPPRSMDPLAAERDMANMRALGEKQFVRAQELFIGATTEVTGRLDLQHRFIDMSNVQIDAIPGASTWSAALGVSFGAGSSEDSIAYATMDGFDVDANIPEGVDLAMNVLGGVTGLPMLVQTITALPLAVVQLPMLIPAVITTLTTGAPLVPSFLPFVMPALAALAFPPSRAWAASRVAAALLGGQLPKPAASLGSCEWSVPSFLTYPPGYETGQGEKPVMFPVGLVKVTFAPAAGNPAAALANVACPLVPHVLPLHLLRIGSVVLAGVPAEFTATAGRRLKDTLRTTMGAGASHVAIAGYCNGYSGYVTTREEYAAQHYEGASTLYGEHTLAAYQQTFAAMAAGMTGGSKNASGQPFAVPLVVAKS